MLLRDCEAKNPECGHLLNDMEGDIVVGEMPLMSVRIDFGCREPAHLIAHGVIGFFKPCVAKCHATFSVCNQCGQCCSSFSGIALA